ncbi:ribonuclease H-like domain-containing protein [Tanacetum coccineum]
MSRRVTFDEYIFPFGSMTRTQLRKYDFLLTNLLRAPNLIPATPPKTHHITTPALAPDVPIPSPTSSAQTLSPPSPRHYSPHMQAQASPSSQGAMLGCGHVIQIFIRLEIRESTRFQQSKADSSLFIYHRGSDIGYLLLYVDDIILTTSSSAFLQWVIASFHGEFAMIDLACAYAKMKSMHDFVDTESKLGANGDRVTLSRFSVEAKYRGVANVVGETAWVRNFLREFHAPLFTAKIVYCDNVSANYLSTNLVQHQCTKHIKIDIHFVRDFVASRQVRVLHVPSLFQYSYTFSKGLPSALFLEFRSGLNVERPLAPTVGVH